MPVAAAGSRRDPGKGEPLRLGPNAVHVLSRTELARCPQWRHAFAGQRRDHRHFELVEDTLHPDFDYRYFAVANDRGEVAAVQPFFVLDQDLLAGTAPQMRAAANVIRRLWPRFMILRTLMVGCVVGEGHLDKPVMNESHLSLLAREIVRHARKLDARLLVLKEFSACYRDALDCFLEHGFSRVPSFPMARLNIAYQDFEQFMERTLSRRMRRDLRLKLKAANAGTPIEQTVVRDIAPLVDEAYPLYLNVYHRSQHHFEKLTKEYLCGLGRRMPDKVRFFVWRQCGRIVAFTVCMVQGETLYAEYIGLDYTVAINLHLYHYAIRQMVSWAMRNGYTSLCSSGLHYDPKFHLRFALDPLDLYVRHTSALMNAFLKKLLPWLAPVRYDAMLKRFPNYHELWAPRARGGSRRQPAADEPMTMERGSAMAPAVRNE